MELKKWLFQGEYPEDTNYIVFAENLKEALQIVNEEEWNEDIDCYYSLDDFYDIIELKILNPQKAYKGCYQVEQYY